MDTLINRSIMKTALVIAFYVYLTTAFSINNDLTIVDKFPPLDINPASENNTAILPRKVRQADPSDPFNQEIDLLKNRLVNLTATLEKESVASAPSGTFQRPSMTNKYTMLENEMKRMKEDIRRLKASPSLSATLKAKLSDIEQTIEKLEKHFDDKYREVTSRMANIESYVDGLMVVMNHFRTELDQMLTRIEGSEKSDFKKALPDEIVQEIKSRNFANAYQKLQALNQPDKLNYIVHEVYANNAGNFDLVMSFADSIKIRDFMSDYLIYKALNYEMESNGHDDPYKLLRLLNDLENNVVSRVGASYLTEAPTIVGKLKSLLKTILVRKMRDSLKIHKFKDIADLRDKVFLTQRALFNEAIIQVTHENFKEIYTSSLISQFETQKYVAQLIYGYSAVFNEMKNRNLLDSIEVITIAYGLKNQMVASNYPEVELPARILAENVKDSLPTSVRNMAFASKVCIRNTARNEYLYAAGDSYKFDNGRRRVLTWVKGTRVNQGDWTFERDGHIFYIKNSEHNEYLYAASNEFNHDDERRSVYTWALGGRINQGRWSITLYGNNVYIRNNIHNEYLFADSTRKLDNGRRHVFTWIHKGVKTADSEWEIEDCS